MKKITEANVMEELAEVLDRHGYPKHASHIRKHGLSIAGGAPPKKSTQLKRSRDARFWFRFRQLRTTGVLKKDAMKRACLECELFIERGTNAGKLDLSRANRIVNGKVRGVLELREQLEAQEEEALRNSK